MLLVALSCAYGTHWTNSRISNNAHIHRFVHSGHWTSDPINLTLIWVQNQTKRCLIDFCRFGFFNRVALWFDGPPETHTHTWWQKSHIIRITKICILFRSILPHIAGNNIIFIRHLFPVAIYRWKILWTNTKINTKLSICTNAQWREWKFAQSDFNFTLLNCRIGRQMPFHYRERLTWRPRCIVSPIKCKQCVRCFNEKLKLRNINAEVLRPKAEHGNGAGDECIKLLAISMQFQRF